MRGAGRALAPAAGLALLLAPVAACSEPGGNAAFACNGMDARDVLADIASRGADLRRARELVFYYYGPEARLAGLQRDIEALGFAVRPARAEPGRIATVRRAVDEAWLAGTMPALCAAAARHGAEYDGWEAEIPEANGR